MTESELLACILDLAKVYGWHTLHIRPALTKHGWRSPVQGDGAGFPDVLACRGDRLLCVELKSDRGVLTAAQREWLDTLEAVGAECHVWKPLDWHSGTVLATLQAAHPVHRTPYGHDAA